MNYSSSSKVPAMLQVVSLFDALRLIVLSAIGGALALAFVGFHWGGWVTGGTAEQMAKNTATTAVVAAYTPVCVRQFEHQANIADQWKAFKKIEEYSRDTFVEKAGFATLPGTKDANSDVADACAQALTKIVDKQPPVQATK